MAEVVAPPTISRFDKARADAAEVATLMLCMEILATSSQAVARAMSLLTPALSGGLGAKINKQEVSRALSGVITDLQEAVSELGE